MRGSANKVLTDPQVPGQDQVISVRDNSQRTGNNDHESWSVQEPGIMMGILLLTSQPVTLLNKSQHRENPRCMKEFCDASLSLSCYCCIFPSRNAMMVSVCTAWPRVVICGQPESINVTKLTNKNLGGGILTAFDNSSHRHFPEPH